VDAPLTPDELIRPWRTATVVASLVAAIELVLLVGVAFMLLAKPLAHAVRRHAETSALAPAVTPTKPKLVHHVKLAPPKLSRQKTRVFVFNGNGQQGAASAAASRLISIGYHVPGTANAKRQNYANTVVMYRRGFAAEGARLAHDMHVKVVGPLDGMSTSALHGAQLAVVLGAR
jgi:LytR cell envelope-related transcriptional attenuator